MGLSDLTAPAVNQAIKEFNHLKRKAFLKKYKFGKAKSYFLKAGDLYYDSKAIAGAAHGYPVCWPKRVHIGAAKASFAR